MNFSIDAGLIQFATPRQREYIEAVNNLGSLRAAARQFDVHPKTIQDAVKRVTVKASAQGYSPAHNLTKIIPAPYIARGHSTQYDRDGKLVQQWVKTRLDDQRYQEAITAAAAALAEELPRLAPTPAPSQADAAKEIANLYVLTDAHVGMLAWEREGGANWDVKIAERVIYDCFMLMLDSAPTASTGIIAQLGDFFHSDGLLPVTPTSNHVLDQDGRYAKIVGAGIRLLRRIIDAALERHERVVILMAEGNHDQVGSMWLQKLLGAIYENEPRIEVIETPLPYYAIEHGKTALFFHHGHKKKKEQLPLAFAAMFREIWGRAKKSYIHTGHYHALDERDHQGCIVLQHPTLAARDAYAARGAWLSERQAMVISYHREFGEVNRKTVTPEMISR
ncbi:metallophosphoesterase [Rhodobacter phage RcCWillis]|nr:metallophosphoesterase [Rhodobacter phage RcCWillis]